MKVSLLLPTLNRPRLLPAAIGAMLAQDYDDVEIVVNDGSDEPCPSPILTDERVVVMENGSNLSIANALNAAAEAATGDIFYVASDDNLMLHGTIVSALAALAGGARWTCGRMIVDDGKNLPWVSPLVEWDPEIHGKVGNQVQEPTVFMTRRAFEESGGFNEIYRCAQDYEMWGRLGAVEPPAVRDHVDVFYRLWEGSLSTTAAERCSTEVEMIQAQWSGFGFGGRA